MPVATQVQQVPPLAPHSLADEEGLLPSQGVAARKSGGVELHELHARQVGVRSLRHGLPVPSGYCRVRGCWEHLRQALVRGKPSARTG